VTVRNSHRFAWAVLLTLSAPILSGAVDLTSNRELRLLAAHNRERSAHGIQPLRWDPRLAESASQWGEHLRKTGTLVHSVADPHDNDPEGENLWAGTRGHYSPEAMVGLWANEKKDFKPGRFPNNSKTGRVEDVGHYTQLMWRSTTRVGCAVTENTREEFLVCRYNEGGNVVGEQPF
jgi:hypothetical protein